MASSKTLLEALAGSGLDVGEQALKEALKKAAAAEVAPKRSRVICGMPCS